MPWKLNGDAIELKDGNPVWIFADGKEEGANFERALAKILALNDESSTRRKAAEDLAAKVKEYETTLGEGGSNLEAIKKALETVKGLSEKKLIEAGEAQKIRDDAVADFKVAIAKKDEEIAGLHKRFDNKMIENAFAGSALRDKLSMPWDWALSRLGENFKVEDGKVVGLIGGQAIRSQRQLGDIAPFDEALEQIINSHPQKDMLWKADGASGSGAQPGSGVRPQGNAKTMPRTQFDALPAAAQSEFSLAGGQLTEA